MAGAELGARHVLSAAYDPDRPRPLRGAARGRAGPPRLSRRRREHGERTVIMSPGPENHSLAEKIAVVTGAGSGIGRAVALAKAGAAVACLDIDRTGAEYGWS